MNKKGKEQNEHLAQETLKQCIKDVHKTLQKHQLSNAEIVTYLKPIETLIADVELWRNPSEGLAIFLDKKGFHYYTLPIPFITKTQIATVVLLLLYAVYEFVVLAKWKANLEGPPIRVDLIIVYTILLSFIVISFSQAFKQKNWIIGVIILLLFSSIIYFTL